MANDDWLYRFYTRRPEWPFSRIVDVLLPTLAHNGFTTIEPLTGHASFYGDAAFDAAAVATTEEQVKTLLREQKSALEVFRGPLCFLLEVVESVGEDHRRWRVPPCHHGHVFHQDVPEEATQFSMLQFTVNNTMTRGGHEARQVRSWMDALFQDLCQSLRPVYGVVHDERLIEEFYFQWLARPDDLEVISGRPPSFLGWTSYVGNSQVPTLRERLSSLQACTSRPLGDHGTLTTLGEYPDEEDAQVLLEENMRWWRHIWPELYQEAANSWGPLEDELSG